MTRGYVVLWRGLPAGFRDGRLWAGNSIPPHQRGHALRWGPGHVFPSLGAARRAVADTCDIWRETRIFDADAEYDNMRIARVAIPACDR